MTAVLERDPEVVDPEVVMDSGDNRNGSSQEEAVSLRPILAAGLATAAAALVVGGVFNSWPARICALLAGSMGAGLAAWAARSKRAFLAQLVVPFVILGVAMFSVLPGGSPGDVRRLAGDAIDAARLLQIPIPFDPGWRPLLVLIFGFLGFGSAWVGSAMKRPMLGVLVPVPLVALAAISQPTSQQVLAGVFAFLPILAAFGVLFGGDDGPRGAGELNRAFELTRIVRGGVGMIALAVALVVLGHTSFLFPKPAFDPNDRPQKPKSIPLSEQRDRVLFTVDAPAGFTGPWRTNVLDVYDDGVWKLPGTSPGNLASLPESGQLNDDSTQDATVEVTITTADLGPTAAVPMVPTAQRVAFVGDRPNLRVDKRSGVLKVPAGRAPNGLVYKLSLAPYPTAVGLAAVTKATHDATHLDVPNPPAAIQRLMAAAPPGLWPRLDYVRHQLLDHVTATGAGSPAQITPKRVVDLLNGSKKGTPYEIVAAQAVLARWVGVPSRIGTGYVGLNEENGKFTVRPKNAEQWLEVYFDGYGWLPLLDVPPKAQADLANKDQDDRIEPSTDIAAQIYVPVEVDNPRLLFEQVRDVLYMVSPFLAALLLLYMCAPMFARTARRLRRERWAEPLGPRARVAVAYAEFRDAATDLSVGDPFATPIEFLDHVHEDGEHRELAWLVTRALYGDLAYDVTDADALLGEEMANSLIRRLRQAQPMQARFVAALARSSLVKPFSDEMPNVAIPTPLRALRLALVRAWRATRRVVPRRGRRALKEVASQ